MSTFGMTRMGGMTRDARHDNSSVIPMPLSVIPRLDRGIYAFMPKKWIPAFAGMTILSVTPKASFCPRGLLFCTQEEREGDASLKLGMTMI